MSEVAAQNLSGVSEMLLIILSIRAFESQRPDALVKDERAQALVSQMDQNFLRNKLAKIEDYSQVATILRSRDFDRCAQEFLARHPQAVNVHIGCGLDTRFERVCSEQPHNGRVEWYDLDLPGVIELRRKLVGGERERYHLLACSVLDNAWLDTVSAHRQRSFLFLAEGVFMYFTEAQVKSLVLTLRDHFPGAELVFDGWRPFEVWLGNRYLSNSPFAGLMQWSFWRGREIEGWGDGVHLLDKWGFFDQPEPRLDSYRWMAPLFRLFKPMRILRFQLGEAAGQVAWPYGEGER
jgi:O-methyltransferase involved in polyketide biosynthesis